MTNKAKNTCSIPVINTSQLWAAVEEYNRNGGKAK